MKEHRKRGVRDSCAHTAEGDGANPKFDRDHEDRRERHWKHRQLAHHAARAIEAELMSRPRAIDLGLRVAAVEVVSGGSTLRVDVVWDAQVPLDEVKGWLAVQQGPARAALARALNRKRVPVVVLIAVGRIEPDSLAQGDDHETP